MGDSVDNIHSVEVRAEDRGQMAGGIRQPRRRDRERADKVGSKIGGTCKATATAAVAHAGDVRTDDAAGRGAA